MEEKSRGLDILLRAFLGLHFFFLFGALTSFVQILTTKQRQSLSFYVEVDLIHWVERGQKYDYKYRDNAPSVTRRVLACAIHVKLFGRP